jgi:rhodanese-related sulfurtransferase
MRALFGLARFCMQRLLEYVTHHPWYVALAVAMALVYELRDRGQNFSALQPQEAIRLMNQGAQVIDLRDTAAFAAGHVTGARHLAPDQRDGAVESLKKFKDRMLVLYCEEGQQAATLTRQLHAGGFTKVFTLRGGLAAWRAEGLPLQRG